MEVEVYIKELENHLRMSFISFREINKYLESKSKQKRMIEFWYHLQSLLSSCAIIGKILYPKEGSSKYITDRAQALREALKMKDHSIFSEMKVRNRFEHFDERLDKFIKSQKGNEKYYVDMNIVAVRLFGNTYRPERFLRHYDPETKIISIQGEEISLLDLNREIAFLEDRLEDYRGINK